MKRCGGCDINKPISEFYLREKGKPASKCKNCFNMYCVKRWIKRKISAIEFMGGQCADCEQKYHYAVYDFHHLYGKDSDWTTLRKKSLTKIRLELKKCILLCANCHKIRHISLDSSVG